MNRTESNIIEYIYLDKNIHIARLNHWTHKKQRGISMHPWEAGTCCYRLGKKKENCESKGVVEKEYKYKGSLSNVQNNREPLSNIMAFSICLKILLDFLDKLFFTP